MDFPISNLLEAELFVSFLVFFLLIQLYYAMLLFRISKGLKRAQDRFVKRKEHLREEGAFSGMTVVIPVRNEEQNMKTLLGDLNNLNYAGQYEILFIDDHSSDHTAERIRRSANKYIRYSSLAPGQEGKKAALSYGISRANYEVIVCTDGDVRIPSDWLQRIGEHFNQYGWSFCAMPVLIEQRQNYLALFQWCEYLGMVGVTLSGIVKEKYFLANGANMAFTKEAFDKADGFEGNESIASGDDVFLINKIAQQRDMKISYSLSPIVHTQAINSLNAFIRQRIRWGGKNKQQRSVLFHTILWITGLAHISVLVAWVSLPFAGTYRWFLIFGILINLFANYFYLKFSAEVLRQKMPGMGSFFMAWVANVLYLTFIAPLTFFVRKTKWKSRHINTGV